METLMYPPNYSRSPRYLEQAAMESTLRRCSASDATSDQTLKKTKTKNKNMQHAIKENVSAVEEDATLDQPVELIGTLIPRDGTKASLGQGPKRFMKNDEKLLPSSFPEMDTSPSQPKMVWRKVVVKSGTGKHVMAGRPRKRVVREAAERTCPKKRILRPRRLKTIWRNGVWNSKLTTFWVCETEK